MGVSGFPVVIMTASNEAEQDVMSCESSSYDEDGTYADDEGDTPADSEIDSGTRGAQPYMFEPSGDESDEGHDINKDSDEDDPRSHRLNNSNW